MRRSATILLIALFSVFWGCSSTHNVAPVDPHASHRTEIDALLAQYFELFNNEDAEGIARDIWTVPAWTSFGDNQPLPDRAAVAALFAAFLEGLEDGEWGHSEIVDSDIEFLSASAAILWCTFSRFRADGSVIPPDQHRSVYVVLKVEGRWRFVTGMVVDESVSTAGRSPPRTD